MIRCNISAVWIDHLFDFVVFVCFVCLPDFVVCELVIALIDFVCMDVNESVQQTRLFNFLLQWQIAVYIFKPVSKWHKCLVAAQINSVTNVYRKV